MVSHGGLYFGKVVREGYRGVEVLVHDGRVLVVPPKNVKPAPFYEGPVSEDITELLTAAEWKVGQTADVWFTFSVLTTASRLHNFVFFATVDGELKFNELAGRPHYPTAAEAARRSTRFGEEHLIVSAVEDGEGYSPVAVYGVRLPDNVFEHFLSTPALSIEVAERSVWEGHVTVGEMKTCSDMSPRTTLLALRRWDNPVYEVYLDNLWGHPDAHLAFCCNALVAAFRQQKLDIAATLLGMMPTLFRSLVVKEHWVGDVLDVMRNRLEEFGDVAHDIPSLSLLLSLQLCGTEIFNDKEKEKTIMKAMVGEVILRAARRASKKGTTVADFVKGGNYELLSAVNDAFYELETDCDCGLLDIVRCWGIASATNANVDAETIPVFAACVEPAAKKALAAFTAQIFDHSNFNYFYMFMFVFSLKRDTAAPNHLPLAEMHALLKSF
jgi:hypothetical protein